MDIQFWLDVGTCVVLFIMFCLFGAGLSVLWEWLFEDVE